MKASPVRQREPEGPDDDRADGTTAGSPPMPMQTPAELRSRVRELEAELARQARVRSELIHLVSHELRTPITIISGFGRLLKNECQGPLTADQHHFVDETLKACRRLDRFVGDLLAAGPETASPFEVSPRPANEADLHHTIRAQLESLTPLLEERKLSLELDLTLRDLDLCFDASRIEQVVTNLTTNAIRYGRPGGRLRIATRRADGPASPGAVRTRVPGSKVSMVAGAAAEVLVEDDGPGIPEQDRERLFEPYVRGSVSQLGSGADRVGLGIGLSICRRILNAHAGWIRVEASPLGGARFVFGLPGVPRTGQED